MSSLHEAYRARTSRSGNLYKKAAELFPGGVSHPIRHFSPYPFFVTKSKGSKVWDVDGNEYLDFWMGHYALILGHSPEPVVDTLKNQLESGTHWGIVNPFQVELAELIRRMVPSAEKMRFCTSGSEATMYASRLARGHTGKRVILKVEGGWHGYNPDLYYAVKKDYDKADSLGLLPETEKYVKAIPFNDIDGALAVIRREGADLAGIIVEPVLGAGGMIPADKEYLSALRSEADRLGFVLIFDEIVTGFRLGLGGAQEYYGVIPDLTTLGKVLGGGMGIGAVVGRKEILDRADHTRGLPKFQVVGIGGGTFSCNPLSMLAGIATLRYLDGHRELYEKLASVGESTRSDIQKSFREEGIPSECTGLGSLLHVHFPLREDVRIRSGRDAVYSSDTKRTEEFNLRMVVKGHYLTHGSGAISTAHTPQDMKGFLESVKQVAQDMAVARRG